MKIKAINYFSVGHNDAMKCSCCGQGIMNICAVTTIENEHFTFGTTCFGKLMKDRLTSFQRKEMNKIIKFIKINARQTETWKTITEEEWMSYGNDWRQYEDINSFEDYRKWMLEECLPHRLNELEERLTKFRKIEF